FATRLAGERFGNVEHHLHDQPLHSLTSRRNSHRHLPQHCLYFFPLPQGHGSLRPTFGPVRTGFAFSTAAAASLTTSLGLGCDAVELPVLVAPPLPPPNAVVV